MQFEVHMYVDTISDVDRALSLIRINFLVTLYYSLSVLGASNSLDTLEWAPALSKCDARSGYWF